MQGLFKFLHFLYLHLFDLFSINEFPHNNFSKSFGKFDKLV